MRTIKIGFRRVRSGRAAGFTLMELLVSIAILAVIAAIVYESLVGVTSSTDAARVSAEKLRLERYLRQQLTMLFSTAYVDVGCVLEDYAFVGLDETGQNGSADTITFCSSSAMMGGFSLPGMLKRVTIAVNDEGSDQTLGDLKPLDGREDDDASQNWQQLCVTEKPLINTGSVQGQNGSQAMFEDAAATAEADLEEFGFDTPSWNVPIHSLDIAYFDGEDWVEEWDSLALGRLPWSVRIRINFARTPEQLEQDQNEGIDLSENPDVELIVPIPLGMGVESAFLSQSFSSVGEGEGEGETESDTSNVGGTGRKPTSRGGTPL